MKKNQNKSTKIMSKIKRQDADEDTAKRSITSSNIEEHREKALESGRKFKYPLHVPLHRILINAAIIFVLALAIFGAFSWWRLYKAQDTSDFFYTAVRIVPIPVAMVDGEPVLYGDYMRRLRASIYYLENQEGRDLTTEDGQRELEHTRRFSMNEAQRVALANKIAHEQGIIVSDEEIDTNIDLTLSAESGGNISTRAYESSLRRYFGWSMDDYRHIVRDRLMIRKVSFAIDDTARNQANDIKRQLDVGGDFAVLAEQYSNDEATRHNGGDAGTIRVDNIDQNGLIAAAQSLNQSQVSDVIEGIDAFYIIKLTEKTDTIVRYSMIRIELTEFDKRFDQLRADGLITECIEIDGE